MPPILLSRPEVSGAPTLYHRDRVRITIWTHRREPLLGCWVGTQWSATPLGRAAQECWRDLPREYPAWRFELLALQPCRVDALLQIPRPPSDLSWDGGGSESIFKEIRPLVALFKARVARLAYGDRDYPGSASCFRPWQLGYELRRLADEITWRLALRELSCRLLGLIRD